MSVFDPLVGYLFGSSGIFPRGSHKLSNRERRRIQEERGKRIRKIGALVALGVGTAGAVLIFYPRSNVDNLPQPKTEIVSKDQTKLDPRFSDLSRLPLLPPATKEPSPIISRGSPPVSEKPIRSSEPTLENVRKYPNDRELGQAYLNRMLSEGKIKFEIFDPIYDLGARELLETLRKKYELTDDTSKKVSIEEEIKRVNSDVIRLKETFEKINRGELQYADVPITSLQEDIDGSKKAHFYGIPLQVSTDKDFQAFLQYIQCRVEIQHSYKFEIPNKYDPQTARRTLDLYTPLMTEADCLGDLLIRSTLSEGMRNVTSVRYEEIYNLFSLWSRGSDILAIISQQILRKLKSPRELYGITT